jgi:hypothetical protein
MRERAKAGAVIGGALGALIGAVAAWWAASTAAATAARAAGLALGAVKLGWRALTLDVWRRCPDCWSRVDSRARVCRRCGHQRWTTPS